MTSIHLGLLLAILGLGQWILETFFESQPLARKALKSVSFFVAALAVWAAHLGRIESNEQSLKVAASENQVLSIQNDSLLLKNENLSQAIRIQELTSRLAIEQDRIKTLSGVVKVRFSGEWTEENCPFSAYTIALPVRDTVLARLVPNGNGETVEFTLVELYQFRILEPGKRAEFYAKIVAKESSEIFAKSSGSLSTYQGVYLSIPFVRWAGYGRPIRVEDAEIALHLSGQRHIGIRKVLNGQIQPFPPHPGQGPDVGHLFASVWIRTTPEDFRIRVQGRGI